MSNEARQDSPNTQVTSFEFTSKISTGLKVADNNFEARRRIVDTLQTQVILFVEGENEAEKRVLYITCALGFGFLTLSFHNAYCFA